MPKVSITHISIIRFLLPFAILAITQGCSINLPEHFASPSEAFPDAASMDPPLERQESFEKAMLSAPYEAAFRAAELAVTGTGFNITDSNVEKGIILAKRVDNFAKMCGWGGYNYIDRYHFYAITVKKLQSEQSEIRIVAKAQQECKLDISTHPISWGIVSFGILIIPTMLRNDECRACAEVHWATDDDSAETEMNQFITNVRRNLIAMGLVP